MTEQTEALDQLIKAKRREAAHWDNVVQLLDDTIYHLNDALNKMNEAKKCGDFNTFSYM